MGLFDFLKIKELEEIRELKSQIAKTKLMQIVIFFTLFSSCATIYLPCTPNIPLFQNKHEFLIEPAVSINGLNLKTAFAPINHFALQANGQVSVIGQSYYKEAALGYYNNFANNIVLEIYGGYGQGAFQFTDSWDGSDYHFTRADGNYNKIFGQINIGFPFASNKGYYGASLRVGNVQNKYSSSNFANVIGTTFDHNCIEPYLFLKKKLSKNASLVYHFGLTFLQDAYFNSPFPIRTNFINVGIGFNITVGKKEE